MAATLLEKVKLSLRWTHGKLDADLQEQIDAALADLEVCGVIYAEDTDPLIVNAVKLFCKAGNADDPYKGAELMRRYEALKSCLMMAEGYGREAEPDE